MSDLEFALRRSIQLGPDGCRKENRRRQLARDLAEKRIAALEALRTWCRAVRFSVEQAEQVDGWAVDALTSAERDLFLAAQAEDAATLALGRFELETPDEVTP